VIENMTGFTTPDGVSYPIFGEGGGRRLAEELEVPLLGQIPLTMALREQSDGGLPVVLSAPEDPAARAITAAAARLVALNGVPLPMLAEPEPEPELEPATPVGMSLPMA
jgi:ATP-binding protein involved in chromosome partitioning